LASSAQDTCSSQRNGALAEAKRRKAWVLAHEIELDRDQRLELASYMLRRDITSWKHLEAAQVERMLDAMEGYQLICQLKAMD
jgi:hypothetical protein